MTVNPNSATGRALDRADARVREDEGLAGALRGFLDRVRSGDLGMIPVAVGLVLISLIFAWLNPVFLRPGNVSNLLYDCATTGVISLGIVCVLMLGEIDLSVGSMSGLASAILGVLWINQGWPVIGAILVALLLGAAVGALYAALYNRVGMPSFVATLAGLLALLGLQLYLLGNSGSINLPFSLALVRFGQNSYMPNWLSVVLAIVPAAVVLWSGLSARRRRQAAGLTGNSLSVVLAKAIALAVALEAIVLYLAQGRGVPWMFALFVLLVALMDYLFTRTQWGRSMMAVGGNREAARRAGINVRRIYLSAFVLCSTFAALGGILSAARLGSASQQAGTGDVNLNAIAAAVIGGTSLFGGRGSAYSALLGIVVIQAISNGLTLLNLSSSLRYMILGGVLALAVIVDSLARRSRASHGRG
ncbi:sugar ABC transporter permease [Aureimonas jatrophae]|uniref:Xylose transport system permease protein XylH n=1 Tax=Aureimonas jatrophae TaxID=1166073 RepID=A0A1H0C2E2_9HYPH|nr:ABC transporter permease [Aureimonas jatrophae]MBB3949037.1 D-xylose transport system permease protein [Aureimonas jatrophae]SDN52026.1 D-xylose transport system permease protein [Aureimonas jatrophae]